MSGNDAIIAIILRGYEFGQTASGVWGMRGGLRSSPLEGFTPGNQEEDDENGRLEGP